MELFKKKDGSGPSVQANMLYNTIGSVVYYFCVWLTTVLIVRMSGYYDAGILSIATTVTSGPALIGLFNIRNYQISDLKGEYSDRTYIESRLYTNILSFMVCLGMALAYGYGSEPKKLLTILSYMILKIAEGQVDVYHGLYQKKARLDYAAVSFLLRGIGSLASFIIFFELTKDITIAILSMGIVSFLVVLLYDKRKAQPFVVNPTEKVEWKNIVSLLVRCTPIAVASFMTNLSTTLPRTYLEKFHGEDVMGYYASVSAPTVVVQLAAITMFAPLIPIITKHFIAGDKKGFLGIILKFLALMAVLTVIAWVGSIFLADPVLRLVFGQEIGPYTNLFPAIMVAAALIAINSSFASICTLMRIIKAQYIVCIAGVAVALISSFTIVKTMSMNGVILALYVTLLVQILIQLVLILLGMRKMNVE